MFNYSTLQVSLQKETKTLSILLNRPEDQNRLNTEMLFELESILAWASSKIEINSILISSTSNVFCMGLDEKEIQRFDHAKLTKHLNKIRKLIKAFFYMPQTIIVDMKKNAAGIGVELAIGADIRIADNDVKIDFNHLKKGFTPTCGGISLLPKIIPASFARSWIMSSSTISKNALEASGFILFDQNIDQLLHSINEQAPIERIQCKNAFNLSILDEVEKAMKIEESTNLTTLLTEDWKQSEFTSARAFASVAQKIGKNLEASN